MNPKELYTERIKTLTDEIYQLNKYNRLVVVLELTAIALAIGCVVAYTIWGGILVLVVAALFIAVYVAIRWKDSRNSRLSEQKENYHWWQRFLGKRVGRLPRLGTYVSMIMQIVTSDLKSQEGRDIIGQLSADEQDAYHQ
ncbi:MAG: hypothetical protein E7107_10235 [Prevotella sp.]|nr:hypothetical protein [Prevotella sp.]